MTQTKAWWSLNWIFFPEELANTCQKGRYEELIQLPKPFL